MVSNAFEELIYELSISDDDNESNAKRKKKKQLSKNDFDNLQLICADKSKKIQEKRKIERMNYRKNKSKMYKQLNDEGLFKNKKEKALHDHKLQELSLQSKKVVIIDLSYNSLMNYNELLSLACQIGRAYGQNKSRKNLICYHLFGCSNEIMTYFDKMGSSNWKMHFHKETLMDFFEEPKFSETDLVKNKNEIMYFSPDSPTELEELNDEFIVVLGGLVDKSVKKNQSLDQAINLGLRSVRLPISKYTNDLISCIPQTKKLNENQPLNVDNVVNIIHDYLESKSWIVAFNNNICKRIKEKLVK